MAMTYDPIFAVDPANPANVAKNASITIFDPADVSQAPITITDPTGVPLDNPITVDAAGMGPAFQHATLARVGWKGAGFTGYFTSYEGMFNETVAAKAAASTAATAAATAANSAETAAESAVATVTSALASAVADAEAAATAATNAAALVDTPADDAIAAAVAGNGATKEALDADYGPAAASMKAAYGRTYRPEAYGAVGDGIADDLPAFRAIESAINAQPNVPAKIEITGKHYVSNGINFDGEDIEIYLAAGSHIFTKAATNVGHTLGFIGYLGAGTAVSPARARVKIHGPGKVTGWMGAAPSTAVNNENAIGVVRYKSVEIDGPQDLEGGNKAFTTQYGVERVSVRNVSVKRANFRGVSVEDGATDVDLTAVRVDSSGAAAVVVSAERVSYRDISVGTALTGEYATEAAVRITGTALTRATADGIRVTSAGSGKGLIIFGATNLALADNIRVGASTGNAVELQNCTGSNYVGLVDAPASPGPVVATGTTVASAVKRTGQPDTAAVTITATRFTPVTGTPVIGMAGAQLPGYMLDSAATEAVAVLLGRDVIPASWKTFAVDVVWTNNTTNAGNVRHDASYSWLGDGDPFSTGTYVSGTAQAAPTAFGTLKVSRLISSVTADAAKNLYLRVIRNGGDATADTLPNDSGLVAVKLVRLS